MKEIIIAWILYQIFCLVVFTAISFVIVGFIGLSGAFELFTVSILWVPFNIWAFRWTLLNWRKVEQEKRTQRIEEKLNES